ncbi:MAG: IclR family transcriptional regulator [Bacteroidetes bacterium]|nr:MAG: IclR family transcriptional regulator [Bacteroidota bacterium]
MKHHFTFETENRYLVPSVERAVQVLGVLAREPRGMVLADLARETGIPKSTLFRILVTLRKHHCVTLDPESQAYRLGSYLFELGNKFAEQSDLFRVATRYMQSLAEECGETVFLSKLEDGEVVYLRRMDSPKSIAVVKKLQSRVPAHCTATGVAMLAWLPSQEVEEILDRHGMEAYNEATLTDRDLFMHRLEEVRRRQYAVVDGEYNRELLCVSAPVWDHSQRPCAALTVAMLSSQVADESRVARVGEAVRRTARLLSRELGGREPVPA